MGLMETLRNSTKYIIILLIGSFGILWVLSDVGVTNLIGAGPRDVGSVNGDRISIEEYQERVQYYNNVYSQQTGTSMTPELTAIYEQQVWDDLVVSRLVEQKMDELGITVTDQELLDMVYGDNPDPIIAQNFRNEDGTINRAALEQVMRDPGFSQQALALDIQLRQTRRQQKLSNFITAGLQVTPLEVEEEYKKRNTRADISYVRFPYSRVSDDEISISDSDLKKYYNDHKDNYKQDENYRLKFVKFSKLPTAADTSAIFKEVNDLRNEFAEADNDSLFLAQNGSTTRYSNAFIDKNDIREDFAAVLDVNVGEVTEPFVENGQITILKKVDEKGQEIKFAAFSRIIEALFGTINKANELAEDFRHYAMEETSFDEEAERNGYTVLEAAATKGTPFISGIGNSQQVMKFLESSKRGKISGVIELANDFVVVQITQKNKEGYRPFDAVKDQVEAQVKIQKRTEKTVEEAKALLANNSNLAALAEAADLEVVTQTNIKASDSRISGAGSEPEVIGRLFNLNQDEISGVLVGTNAAFVIKVDAKSEADMDKLTSDQREMIKEDLEIDKNDRFLSVWLEQLKKEAKIVDNRDRLFTN